MPMFTPSLNLSFERNVRHFIYEMTYICLLSLNNGTARGLLLKQLSPPFGCSSGALPLPLRLSVPSTNSYHQILKN